MKISLNVIPPARSQQIGGTPPPYVQLSEPMVRFACNQKGCCCSGWDIPFQLEDFVRLYEHLEGEERERLQHGLQIVLDAKAHENGEQVLHSLKLDGVGEGRACRFLESEGACSVHRKHGFEALPDLCIDFPAFGFRHDSGGVELWFDPVCPEVIEQLAESEEPLRLHQQAGFFGDPGLDLRVAHTSDKVSGRIGREHVSWESLEHIRQASVAALARIAEPWRALAVLSHAFRRLRIGNELAFEVVEPEDPNPFLQYLGDCISAHGSQLLAASLRRYRRFIWAIEPAKLCETQDLASMFDDWAPKYEKWVAPGEELLWPLMRRWLAHRFATPMIKGRSELRAACDDIVQLYATSIRYAAGMGEALQRPIDRDLYKVAIGASEYFFRGLKLPREALPSFACTR